MVQTVKLLTADGALFVADVRITESWSNLDHLRGEYGLKEDDDDACLPVRCVEAPIMQKIVQWCGFHMNHSDSDNEGYDDPGADADVEDNVDDADDDKAPDDKTFEWYRQFLQMRPAALVNLLVASTVLGIKRLTAAIYETPLMKDRDCGDIMNDVAADRMRAEHEERQEVFGDHQQVRNEGNHVKETNASPPPNLKKK